MDIIRPPEAQIKSTGIPAVVRPGPIKAIPMASTIRVDVIAPNLKHVPFSVFPVLLDGDGRPLAVLDKVYDYHIQDQLLSEDAGQEILAFKIPSGGKADLILNERIIRAFNRDYVVRVIDDKRDQNGLLVREVTAEAVWYDLATEPPVQPNGWVNRTADVILADVLKGTGWDVGTVEPQQKAGFLVSEPTNVLVCLRQIAVTFGAEIYFDTRYRLVSLLRRVGRDRQDVLFAKGKNITEMLRREDTRSLVTRLYPYGKDNLSIKEINGGKEYIEDYSYFDQRGLPRKTISSIWKDERYTNKFHLKTAAAAKLSQLAQPAVSYDITGVFDQHVELGDIVQVYDTDFGLRAAFRVSQRDLYPIEPWRTQIQLEQPLPQLAGQLISGHESNAGGDTATEASYVQGMNPSAVTIGATSQAIVAIPISTLSSTDAEFIVTITGQASAAATLTVAWMLNGQQIGPTLKHMLASGWNTFSASFILQQVPQTSGILNVMVSVSSGTFSVDIGAAQGYVYAANMLGGGGDMPIAFVEESLPAIITIRENRPNTKLNLPRRVNLQEQLPATLVIQDQVSIQLI